MIDQAASAIETALLYSPRWDNVHDTDRARQAARSANAVQET